MPKNYVTKYLSNIATERLLYLGKKYIYDAHGTRKTAFSKCNGIWKSSNSTHILWFISEYFKPRFIFGAYTAQACIVCVYKRHISYGFKTYSFDFDWRWRKFYVHFEKKFQFYNPLVVYHRGLENFYVTIFVRSRYLRINKGPARPSIDRKGGLDVYTMPALGLRFKHTHRASSCNLKKKEKSPNTIFSKRFPFLIVFIVIKHHNSSFLRALVYIPKVFKNYHSFAPPSPT